MPIVRLNDHDMYYEVLGHGEPVLCMGGWGTFAHDNHHHLARGLTDRYQVIVFDYRGICDSTDDPAAEPTIELHARDAIALLDHLRLSNVHLVGLVGIGAQLGFYIAAQSHVLQHYAIDCLEAAGVNIEPVEVAVEHQRRLDHFLHCQFENRFQRGDIAVKAADDIHGLGAHVGVALKDGRRITVGEGTGAAGGHAKQ